MPKSHAYDLQPAYIVICYPHHQNFRCLTCKTPLLDSIPPQSHWGSPPNPLGTPPKPFGEPSQTLWGTFPNPLGNLPKPFGEAANQRCDGIKIRRRELWLNKQPLAYITDITYLCSGSKCIDTNYNYNNNNLLIVIAPTHKSDKLCP